VVAPIGMQLLTKSIGLRKANALRTLTSANHRSENVSYVSVSARWPSGDKRG